MSISDYSLGKEAENNVEMEEEKNLEKEKENN